VDPEIFYPVRPDSDEAEREGVQTSSKAAMAVCWGVDEWGVERGGECPVRLECLRDALENGLHDGIWGGTTPRTRRTIRSSRRRSRRYIPDEGI
jgi:hypothetical protein